MQEACDLLAALYPRLAAETPDPDCSAFAAPGVTARPPAAPVPGNAAVIYAKTGIDAAARQLEGILLYNAGSRRPGPVRGGSDANTLAALEAIGRLIARADDDLYRMVVAELERRLDEARSVPAIDEAERWRPVPSARLPALRVLLPAGAGGRGGRAVGPRGVLRPRRGGAVPGGLGGADQARIGPGRVIMTKLQDGPRARRGQTDCQRCTSRTAVKPSPIRIRACGMVISRDLAGIIVRAVPGRRALALGHLEDETGCQSRLLLRGVRRHQPSLDDHAHG